MLRVARAALTAPAVTIVVVAMMAASQPVATAQEAPPAPELPYVEGSPGFDPSAYLGQGDAFNCADFKSQAEAQAVLRADPTDPNGLDRDRDGMACETSRGARDVVPVSR